MRSSGWTRAAVAAVVAVVALGATLGFAGPPAAAQQGADCPAGFVDSGYGGLCHRGSELLVVVDCGEFQRLIDDDCGEAALEPEDLDCTTEPLAVGDRFWCVTGSVDRVETRSCSTGVLSAGQAYCVVGLASGAPVPDDVVFDDERCPRGAVLVADTCASPVAERAEPDRVCAEGEPIGEDCWTSPLPGKLECSEGSYRVLSTERCSVPAREVPVPCPEGHVLGDDNACRRLACPDGYGLEYSYGRFCVRFEPADQEPGRCPDGALGEVGMCFVRVPKSTISLTCEVGEPVGDQCEIEGDGPRFVVGVCPVSTVVFLDGDVCFSVLSPNPLDGSCPDGADLGLVDGQCRKSVVISTDQLTCEDQPGYDLVGTRCVRYEEPLTVGLGCPVGTIEEDEGSCRTPVPDEPGAYFCADPAAILDSKACVSTADSEIVERPVFGPTYECDRGTRAVIDQEVVCFVEPIVTVVAEPGAQYCVSPDGIRVQVDPGELCIAGPATDQLTEFCSVGELSAELGCVSSALLVAVPTATPLPVAPRVDYDGGFTNMPSVPVTSFTAPVVVAAEPDASVPAENEVLGLGGDGGDGGDAGSIIAVTGAETTALATIGVTLVAVGAMGVIHARRSRSE